MAVFRLYLNSYKIINNSSLLFILLSLLWVGQIQAGESLTLWIHPYLPATELISKFSPLATYLTKKSGHPITIKISRSYKAHIRRVGEGRMDLAYMGPASFVKMTHIYGKKPTLACLETKGTPFFHGMIITRADSPITNVQGLKGKKIAFGDPNSTMSYFVPLFLLHQAGITLADLDKYAFLGSHNNVALAVLGGYYEAGGIKEDVFYSYEKRGLKMIAQSPPIGEHVFVVNPKLSATTTNLLRQALLALHDQTILYAIKPTVTGMAPVKEEHYRPLHNMLHQLHMLSEN